MPTAAARSRNEITAEISTRCQQMGDYLARLELLTVEPPAPHGGPAGMNARPAFPPEPYGPAGRALMDAHEGMRRLEAWLRLLVLGHLGRARGGSDGNTAEALRMVAKLASRVDDRNARRAAAYLQRHIGAAQSVDGIDEARRWRHLPKHAGERLPPQCPYCRTYYLLADVEARIVVCSFPGCQDSNGDPPIAAMGYDEAGRPVVTWGDGKTQHVPDVAALPRGLTG